MMVIGNQHSTALPIPIVSLIFTIINEKVTLLLVGNNLASSSNIQESFQ